MINPSLALDPVREQTRLAALFKPMLDQASAQIDATRGDSLRRLRANQAARGILRSGVSEYGSGEIEKAANLGMGEAASKLAGLLGQTESQRSLLGTQAGFAEEAARREHDRNMELTRLMGSMKKKKSPLGGFLGGGIGGAGAGASFGPWGAALGGLGGGLLGMFSES